MAWKLFERGQRSIGRYDILAKLGKGGAGMVYKGRDRASGDVVAIKMLNAEVATDARLCKRFEQEFRTVRTLDDPHIVRALDFGHEGNVAFLVMEFVEGRDLWDHISSLRRLPEAEAVDLTFQVAQALQQAHERGLIHRDVKPDNILLTSDGLAKLSDFGLVKDLHSAENLTETATVLGTPNFMAPEQFDDAKRVDLRCDIYGLAATLYMAVTGVLPFRSRGYLSVLRKKLAGELVLPRQLIPQLSERVEQAILTALQVDPAKRHATCVDFIRDLTGDSGAPDRGVSSPEKTPKSAGQERRAAERFACCLKSTCRPVGGEKRARWKAKVRDISASGIGLLLTRRFEPGSVLRLELRDAAPEVLSTLLARVVRIQQQAPRRWIAGCQLACRLSLNELRDLRQTASESWVVIRDS